MKCRHCNHTLEHVFLDLGYCPPSNAYLKKDQLQKPETHYPLKLFVCEQCWLVQTQDYVEADALFDEGYAYFSSTSKSWLEHAETYCTKITKKLNLDHESFVIELAANDGYLLKNFVNNDIPCLGIEPTNSTATAAKSLNIPIIEDFFTEQLALTLTNEKKQADLIIGNNVYAHVPDINDFTAGLKTLLKPEGTITLEFPHLYNLLTENQFDTVYHEHYSYLSLQTVQTIFNTHGLDIFEVEELPTHGGSLRVYGCHKDAKEITSSVPNIINKERSLGMNDLPIYLSFQEKALTIKLEFLNYLLEQKKQGKVVAAYGAAAKGNTLLNFAGVTGDLIECVFDAAPSKQNTWLPGSHIPVLPPNKMKEISPDIFLILPWNLSSEIIEFLNQEGFKDQNKVTAIPSLRVLS